MIVSIMCLCGLPMMVGSFLVEYRSGADIAPDPVKRQASQCGFVATRSVRSLTRVECIPVRERGVRVGQDEVAARVVHDVRMCFAVFFVV